MAAVNRKPTSTLANANRKFLSKSRYSTWFLNVSHRLILTKYNPIDIDTRRQQTGSGDPWWLPWLLTWFLSGFQMFTMEASASPEIVWIRYIEKAWNGAAMVQEDRRQWHCLWHFQNGTATGTPIHLPNSPNWGQRYIHLSVIGCHLGFYTSDIF